MSYFKRRFEWRSALSSWIISKCRQPFGVGRTPGARESNRIDLIRCFLLVQVLFGHLAAISLPTIPELSTSDIFSIFVFLFRIFTRFGPQAAYFFIFLSGYFVGGPLFAALLNKTALSPLTFFRRRIARIIPVLVTALIISAFLDVFAVYALGRGEIYSSQPAYDFLAAMTITNFVGNLLCLEPTFVVVFGSNGPLWTLGYIFQFYIFGFICFSVASVRLFVGFLFTSLCVLLIAVVAPEWSVLFILWLFAALSSKISIPGLSAACVLSIGGFLFVIANLVSPIPSAILIGLAGIFIMEWAHRPGHSIPKDARPAIKMISEASYSIYAIHYPVTFFIFAVFVVEKVASTKAFLVYFIVSVLITYILAHAIETTVRWARPKMGGG